MRPRVLDFHPFPTHSPFFLRRETAFPSLGCDFFCGSTATCETGSVGCETHPKKPEMVRSSRPNSDWSVIFWVLLTRWIPLAWQDTVLQVALYLLSIYRSIYLFIYISYPILSYLIFSYLILSILYIYIYIILLILIIYIYISTLYIYDVSYFHIHTGNRSEIHPKPFTGGFPRLESWTGGHVAAGNPSAPRRAGMNLWEILTDDVVIH